MLCNSDEYNCFIHRISLPAPLGNHWSTGINGSIGQSLTALSFTCLFSLVASWGETGRTLQAISAVLTNNSSHACQMIQGFHSFSC